MVHFVMSDHKLPDSFWGYAVKTVMCILNMIPSKSVFQKHLRSTEGNIKLVYVTSGFRCSAHMMMQDPEKMECGSK